MTIANLLKWIFKIG